ncbi:skin secretory protein xP2-like [Piliocolobus tephrosceles]|uniref:skin secretory protein xP2-like n=1 Tax=Piliocolobus tephrosceles TaxID=591936 RepID=UPI000E6B4B85|nr:skin secretory protein xP2-like [Piliocolobus tephrosceles]
MAKQFCPSLCRRCVEPGPRSGRLTRRPGPVAGPLRCPLSLRNYERARPSIINLSHLCSCLGAQAQPCRLRDLKGVLKGVGRWCCAQDGSLGRPVAFAYTNTTNLVELLAARIGGGAPAPCQAGPRPEASPLTPPVPGARLRGAVMSGLLLATGPRAVLLSSAPEPAQGSARPRSEPRASPGGRAGSELDPQSPFQRPRYDSDGRGRPPTLTPSSARGGASAGSRRPRPDPRPHRPLPAPALPPRSGVTHSGRPVLSCPFDLRVWEPVCPLSAHCHGRWDPFAAAGRSPDGRWEDLACLRPPPPSSGDPGRGSQPLGFPARVPREGPGLRARRPATARAHAPAASPGVQHWAAPARALVRAPRLSAPQPPAPGRAAAGLEHRVHQSIPSPSAALAPQMLRCARAHAETGAAASGPTAREQRWLANSDTQQKLGLHRLSPLRGRHGPGQA